MARLGVIATTSLSANRLRIANNAEFSTAYSSILECTHITTRFGTARAGCSVRIWLLPNDIHVVPAALFGILCVGRNGIFWSDFAARLGNPPARSKLLKIAATIAKGRTGGAAPRRYSVVFCTWSRGVRVAADFPSAIAMASWIFKSWKSSVVIGLTDRPLAPLWLCSRFSARSEAGRHAFGGKKTETWTHGSSRSGHIRLRRLAAKKGRKRAQKGAF
jgi:hypothetical protein